MARVNTGEYKIEFYDGYGAKLRELSDTATSLESAKMLGAGRIAPHIDDGDLASAKSFSIDRRIFNSLE
jgi:hypothetical protein